MTALVFLYFTAWIFIYGGELNAAIAREFPRRRSKTPESGDGVRAAAGRRTLEHDPEKW